MADQYGAANVMENGSLRSITNIIAQMHIENNVNMQVLNENIGTITAKTQYLRSTLVVTHQQIVTVLAGQYNTAPENRQLSMCQHKHHYKQYHRMSFLRHHLQHMLQQQNQHMCQQWRLQYQRTSPPQK